MKTKTIHLRTGNTITLYFSEGLDKWVANYDIYESNRTNFDRLIAGDVNTSNKMRTSIMEFYDNTSELNQKKVKTMINETVINIPIIYDMILTSKINRKRG